MIKRILNIALFIAFFSPLGFAQVRLDSVEVARILNEDLQPATTVQNVQAEEETEDTIVVFESNPKLSWQENIRGALTDVLQNSRLTETAQIGFLAWDLTDDQPLYAYHEKMQLRPASTMKCITAIAALDRLGNDYQFQTQLYRRGELTDSIQTFMGDLYIVGGMDPMLKEADLAVFVDSLKALGIQRIVGNIYADLSLKEKEKWGSGWCWDDDNPTLSPLLLNKRNDFMGRFLRRLQAAGITLQGEMGEKVLPKDATPVACVQRSIAQVMQPMMKQSDNLYAEAVFYQLNGRANGRWTTAKQNAEHVKALIKKVGLSPQNYRIADGSGLSLYNYASAELEVSLLRYAFQNEQIYPTLLASMPIAGVDGTLRNRMRGTKAVGNVRAKTGTLVGVSSLAGYLTASNGHRLCFAIIINGGMSNASMRNLQNKICVILSQ